MRKTVIALSLLVASPFALADSFKLTSPDIKPNSVISNEQVFNGFGCTGNNISPALSWKNPPKDTKSFALLVHDPDAPTGGSGWWHWVVINLPASASSLPSGAGKSDGSAALPGSTQITTDFGGPGWGGPCPPIGDKPHRYNFTLHALKVDKLELPAGATAALAGYMINANSIGKASLTGLFGRQK
ncbi:YbhB/YbcL family Raf kinase inhibitor-like protein [Dechloromonas sp. HYN0024]|uniref:YbhB/YbcL family Raf kinase inhibitor-like protein n=1 Tax=Dechloromonas sp. HYN0024 TaxID=2231055 RepID=UPI000E42D275|nr:YbhB/YbcL family Raf kinase inhibitor-like protein [Dechloromonas sp. HYN0024]AXS79568.1 YbhB/YbcL family Raf kinase inhibitor-like protein [Dechloromonas sp. HYN0024]